MDIHENHQMTKAALRPLIRFYLTLTSMKHGEVALHSQRVAVLAWHAAKRLKKDARAAYLGGIFHDIGKLTLPFSLFDGHNITGDEYQTVKEHVLIGHRLLKDQMLFTGMVCGLHHTVAKGGGYGIDMGDFPPGLAPDTVRKILEIATIVSICDFADAYTHRTTTMKEQTPGGTLAGMLLERFPQDELIIQSVLGALEFMLSKEREKAPAVQP